MNKITLTSVLLLLSLAAASCSSEQTGAPTMGPVEVGVVTLESQAVPRSVELSGRVVAYATAEVRPQVNGLVRRIAFKEGGDVAEGDVLYELDDAKFKAAYAAAGAALKKTAAATTVAQATFDRTETLAASNSVSQQELDDARATLLQAQADEEGAKADVETARINLDNTVIRAPIGGQAGVSKVSVGALVTENQTDAMVTIRQVDPILVDMVDSSANLLRIRDEVAAGQLGVLGIGPSSISLTLETGKEYETTGTLSLADTVVSQTTGTFTIRATFDNPDRVLIPGMFVRARVHLGSIPDAFLVPQIAVTRDAAGEATLYVVSNDSKAELRKITTAGTEGSNWIVVDGVKNGDRLIVDGFQKISEGSEVTPVDAVINADGVVEQELGQAVESATGAAQ